MKMAFQHLVLSLILILGLSNLVLALPAPDFSTAIPGFSLKERAVALDKELICEKNCYASRNNCAFYGNRNILDCEKIFGVCMSKCKYLPLTKRDVVEIEERDVSVSERDISVPVFSRDLNQEALCDKNCYAARNNCAVVDPKLVADCEKICDICIARCAYLAPTKRDVDDLVVRAVPAPKSKSKSMTTIHASTATHTSAGMHNATHTSTDQRGATHTAGSEWHTWAPQ